MNAVISNHEHCSAPASKCLRCFSWLGSGIIVNVKIKYSGLVAILVYIRKTLLYSILKLPTIAVYLNSTQHNILLLFYKHNTILTGEVFLKNFIYLVQNSYSHNSL